MTFQLYIMYMMHACSYHSSKYKLAIIFYVAMQFMYTVGQSPKFKETDAILQPKLGKE